MPSILCCHCKAACSAGLALALGSLRSLQTYAGPSGLLDLWMVFQLRQRGLALACEDMSEGRG